MRGFYYGQIGADGSMTVLGKVGDVSDGNINLMTDGVVMGDYKRLLEIVADPREPDLEEVVILANKYGWYFDEYGVLQEQINDGEDE